MIYVAWIFGFLGVAGSFIIFHQKNRKNLLTFKLISDIFWLIHYMLIGAWSGAAVFGIAIARSIVFLNKEHAWAKSRLWLVGFLICNVISVFCTWKGVFSIFPACASTLSIISYWIGNPRLTRYLQIPIAGSFLTYNIFSRSYMGIVNEILTLTSVTIALIVNRPKHERITD